MAALLEQWQLIVENLEHGFRVQKRSKARGKLQGTAKMAVVMHAVLEGWKQEKPGEQELACFFLTRSGKRAIVKEFVLPKDLARANRTSHEKIAYRQAMSVTCSSCGTPARVIEGMLRLENKTLHRFWTAPCLHCLSINDIEPIIPQQE